MEIMKYKGELSMRYFIYLFLLLTVSSVALGATGTAVTYQANGQSYEGYYISPSEQAPFVLLIHDWDGLTEYEVKRANMPSPFWVKSVIRKLRTKNPGSASRNFWRIR